MKRFLCTIGLHHWHLERAEVYIKVRYWYCTQQYDVKREVHRCCRCHDGAIKRPKKVYYY